MSSNETKTNQIVEQGLQHAIGVRVSIHLIIAASLLTFAGLASALAGTFFNVFLPKTIVLNWTAPGDDDNEGQAARYELRFSRSLITESNWDQANTLFGMPAPKPAGTAEEIRIRTGRTTTGAYYWALKTLDDAGNWSDLSNVVSVEINNSLFGGRRSELIIPTAHAAGETVIDSLPYTITSPGDYILSADLSTTARGIWIKADDVTVNGNGHKITMLNGNEVIKVENGDRVTVENIQYEYTAAGGNRPIYSYGSHDVLFRNITGIGGSAVEFAKGTNVVLTDSRFVGLSGDRAGMQIGLSGEGNQCDSCSATNNHFESTNISGGTDQIVDIIQSDNALFSGNTVIARNVDGHEIIEIRVSSNATISNNRFEITGPDGKFSIRTYTYDSLIEGNIIENPNGFGLWDMGGSSRNVYRNNIVLASTEAFRLDAGGGTTTFAEGNVFIARTRPVNLRPGAGSVTRLVNNTVVHTNTTLFNTGAIDVTLSDSSNVLELRNNILYAKSAPLILAQYSTWTGLNADYNLYFQENPQAEAIKYRGTAYDTLAQFQSGTGQEGSGVSGNPLFVDNNGTSNGDYHVNAGSPVVDIGTILAGIHCEMPGEEGCRPWSGEAPDLGAFELSGEELTHAACQNEQCVVVNGAGSNECAADADCEGGETEVHSECSNEQCVEVPGPGENQCNFNSECVTLDLIPPAAITDLTAVVN